ncbi:hypothetical protein [Frigoribacterium salinisoli]
MYVGIAVLFAVGLVVLMVRRKNYRRVHHEPARSCLAPNRSRTRNYYCQNATPRGGYCRIHHNQRSFDEQAVWTAGFAGLMVVAGGVVLQTYSVQELAVMLSGFVTWSIEAVSGSTG